MVLPNYKDGSIVNLMASIKKAFGGKSLYSPLKELDNKEISKSKNIVLMVIDGLGYKYLKKYGDKSIFNKYLKRSITSVFPPTTATCVTTFATGVAPQQHAITGWFMYLKELGTISTILRFKPRWGGSTFYKKGITQKDIMDNNHFLNDLKMNYFEVMPKDVYPNNFKKGKQIVITYNTLRKFFENIKKIINSGNKRKFIYAYWPNFDSICHKYGVASNKTKKHFKELDKNLSNFLKSIEGTNTTLIITADHGLIDTTDNKKIYLKNHKKFVDCLTLPLSGEPRTAYCYVRPSKLKQFKNYVKNNLKNIVILYKSEDLIKKKLFGLFEPNKKLFERVGDYIIIMKDKYVIHDTLLGEKEKDHIGYHGGVSEEEMLVPLIIINK